MHILSLLIEFVSCRNRPVNYLSRIDWLLFRICAHTHTHTHTRRETALPFIS